jgi:hypothetical protein
LRATVPPVNWGFVIFFSLVVQIICVSEVCDSIRETRKDRNGPRS